MHLLALAEGGFNPMDFNGIGGTFWTWVIFLLALVPAWKFVLGPISRALIERDEAALAAVTKAEAASRDAEQARAEVEVKLGEARTEAAKILAAARDRGESREREIVEHAKQEAAAMLENARSQIRSEQEKALAAIRGEVVELTLGAASKVLERNVASEDDRRIVGEFVGAPTGGGDVS